ncbi:MAG: tetraacyldisaccharide 4'-kinase [Candidatus Aureabacteria bacterium]|nr:tetraacyldisaccharide 4'-kinase [Candidatus Auribacterota bacterium]
MYSYLYKWIHSVWELPYNLGRGKWILQILTWLALLYEKIVKYRDIQASLKPKIVFRAQLISIGNLTVGGTGKTPLVAWMALYLQTKTSLPVGIVLRGYGRRKVLRTPVLVDADVTRPGLELDLIGDEARLLSELCPQARIMVCSDRIKAIERLEKDCGCEFIILDDAFQQRQFAKCMDILCLDSRRPFGNGYLLPRGPLREPISFLAKGTHFVFPKGKPRLRIENQVKAIVGQEKSKQIYFFNYDILGAYLLNDPLHVVDINRLEKEKLGILSSIGNPESFSKTLEMVGIQGPHQDLPDHIPYDDRLFFKIQEWIQKEGVNGIITTEKDAVRLKGRIFNVPCYVIEMELFLPDEWIHEVKNQIQNRG